MELTVSREERFAVIAPAGRVTAPGVPQLKQAIEEVIADGQPRIVVDLARTDFVDSSALGALIGGLKSARSAGGDLRIANVTEPVRRVLSLTNLDRVLRDHPSVESAFDE